MKFLNFKQEESYLLFVFISSFIKLGCDQTCGCGYTYTDLNVDGDGKEWSYPGKGIWKCADVCSKREGCTSFEYNHEGTEGYKCGTYTAGRDNVQDRPQKSDWTTCIKGNTIF